jgi:iron(III) transport system ATP-binding protein
VTAPAIAVSNVFKRLGSHEALSDVSLEVDDGSAVVVLGPSGCGKTTLLRVVGGLEVPDRGTVAIRGVTVAENGRTLVPPYQRGIGFVFQDLALWPHLTAARNLQFVLDAIGTPRSEQPSRITDALGLVRVEPLARRYPHELSGGEQQRVALARALVSRPKALLLDEPFSSLDDELRAALRAELSRLGRELGIAMVYVTHDRQDVSSLADRVVEMRGGRVVAARL